MRIRTASDAVYTSIAWLPLLAVAVGVAWVLATGLLNLEQRSWGTEFLVSNAATDNRLERLGGPSSDERLQAAIDSGDLTQMMTALDEVEAEQRAAAGTAAPGAGAAQVSASARPIFAG